jgi:hypothetical protein
MAERSLLSVAPPSAGALDDGALDDGALDDGAPVLGPRTEMVGNVPISLMCSSVPEVQAGPTFGSITVPSPTVAVALVTVAAYFAISARATATATLNCPSVSEPCAGAELELPGSSSTRLALLAHPPSAIAASTQATAVTLAGTTLGRDRTTEWFHENTNLRGTRTPRSAERGHAVASPESVAGRG